MPLYKYESYNRSGKIVSGTIDMSSLDMAKKTLQGQSLMPFRIEEFGSDKIEAFAFSFFEPQIDIKTKIIFTKQLAVLLKAGVPLLQALELLIEQFEKKFKRILINVKDGVKSGNSFASELGKYPKVFSNIYVQLVRAGEASGKLHLILEKLIDYMAREADTKQRIKKATNYPMFVLGFSALVVIVLIKVLVPRITDIFIKMSKTELPGPTLFLKNVSDFLNNNFFSISIIFTIIFLLFLYWKSTKNGKRSLDELFLKIPMISYFSKTKAVVQFCQTLGILLSAGVNLAESLDIVSNIVENSVLHDKLEIAKGNIIKEGKIAKYLKQTEIFPNIATYMIETGEQSGNLDNMLLTVGVDYDEELK
ncbi:type II secretion system F family protein, partial [Candidatus Dependentiae bacterium]|nr:type II secretion system F family protein [Candidatus Dependentiae bacterium]